MCWEYTDPAGVAHGLFIAFHVDRLSSPPVRTATRRAPNERFGCNRLAHDDGWVGKAHVTNGFSWCLCISLVWSAPFPPDDDGWCLLSAYECWVCVGCLPGAAELWIRNNGGRVAGCLHMCTKCVRANISSNALQTSFEHMISYARVHSTTWICIALSHTRLYVCAHSKYRLFNTAVKHGNTYTGQHTYRPLSLLSSICSAVVCSESANATEPAHQTQISCTSMHTRAREHTCTYIRTPTQVHIYRITYIMH